MSIKQNGWRWKWINFRLDVRDWFYKHVFGLNLNKSPGFVCTAFDGPAVNRLPPFKGPSIVSPEASKAISASMKGFFNPPAALAETFFAHTHPFKVHHWHAEGVERLWCCWCGRSEVVTPTSGVPAEYLRQQASPAHCNINHETGQLRTVEAAAAAGRARDFDHDFSGKVVLPQRPRTK